VSSNLTRSTINKKENNIPFILSNGKTEYREWDEIFAEQQKNAKKKKDPVSKAEKQMERAGIFDLDEKPKKKKPVSKKKVTPIKKKRK
jgi:hypothetical protein